jgi:CRISPR/Cas system endoribonuclease Cas6 (RAMP superfamily)
MYGYKTVFSFVQISFGVMSIATMSATTTAIINEFVEQIDTENEYQLKEMKQILSDIYKIKTKKPKAEKPPKKAKDCHSETRD